MGNSERKPKVAAIWSEAVLDGKRVRVSIVTGNARILIDGFDIHVHGKLGGCDDVIAEYKRQQVEIEKAFANLPSEPDEPSCSEPNCGLIPISDEDLAEQIREFEKQRKVICMKTRQTI